MYGRKDELIGKCGEDTISFLCFFDEFGGREYNFLFSCLVLKRELKELIEFNYRITIIIHDNYVGFFF